MMKCLLRLVLACIFLIGPDAACAQSTNKSSENYPDTLHRGRLTAAIATTSSLYVGSLAYLQYVWYKDTERVPFHYYNDNPGYLQIDKFSHAFGAYLESYAAYHWLRHSGVSKSNALIYGGGLGFVFQAPIEVFDGLYEGWGFSWGDIAANAAGSAFVIAQEMLWDEQKIKYKFSFHRSAYADNSNGMLGDSYLESLLYDYNGHTYWLSAGIHEITLQHKLPNWLNLSVGYSANGMYGEFENRGTWGGETLPEVQRYRQFLLSLDVDWSRIKTNSDFLNSVLKSLFFVKLPFPTLEVNTLGEIKGHWLYF